MTNNPTDATSSIRIFCYGSNMSTKRLRRRAQSARFVSVALLPGHRFAFHKKSNDGSAKADAVKDENADGVWGVVFEVCSTEKQKIDIAEGLKYGYEESKVVVLASPSGNSIDATMYYATAICDLMPFSWYKAHVVNGATEHNLPAEYVKTIVGMPDQEDHDSARDRRERAVGAHAR